MAIQRFYQNGGRPPSWISRARTGTTHEDYLVVFIVVLNLVGIAAVKGKVFPYSLPSVGPGADPGVQAVSPQVT